MIHQADGGRIILCRHVVVSSCRKRERERDIRVEFMKGVSGTQVTSLLLSDAQNDTGSDWALTFLGQGTMTTTIANIT